MGAGKWLEGGNKAIANETARNVSCNRKNFFEDMRSIRLCAMLSFFHSIFLFELVERFFAGESGDLFFPMFNSGEEFEDHEKHKNKPNHDNGVYISLDADNVCDVIAEFRKDGNCRHTTPHDNPYGEFKERLSFFVPEIS